MHKNDFTHLDIFAGRTLLSLDGSARVEPVSRTATENVGHYKPN